MDANTEELQPGSFPFKMDADLSTNAAAQNRREVNDTEKPHRRRAEFFALPRYGAFSLSV